MIHKFQINQIVLAKSELLRDETRSVIDNLEKYNVHIKTLKLNTENINSMIKESDIILNELSWDHNKGREYLLKEFNVPTRMDLNENQLISFIDKLKLIRSQHLSK